MVGNVYGDNNNSLLHFFQFHKTCKKVGPKIRMGFNF